MIARVKKKSCIWTIVAVILVLLLAWVGLTKSRYRTQTHDTNNGANFDGKSQSNILLDILIYSCSALNSISSHLSANVS
jgi:hypothetical protein